MHSVMQGKGRVLYVERAKCYTARRGHCATQKALKSKDVLITRKTVLYCGEDSATVELRVMLGENNKVWEIQVE